MNTKQPAGNHPIPVVRALRKLGQNISHARRRRRIPAALLAERAGINRMTLYKIERGELGVSMGAYATVLFALDLLGPIADLADVKNDPVGLSLEEERLPKRIHIRRKKTPLPPKKNAAD
jgi:transcriptional regulator with XRE-family HTH domain